ncbi:MAG: hypothetical protein J6V50_04795, partial [Clostridia bacterium]|nr:hypothetical protein [Clostridia bacterium]
GDLYYFLVKLLYKVAGENKKLKDKADKCYRCCIDKGAVYIPHIKNAPKRIAMLRNPHLSRNEDVLTEVVSDETKKCYDAYLGNLKGVVFVGHNSCIPAALGGADFDGDLVIIAYDERIIKACGFGYVETKEEGEKSVPFVKIPTLKGEAKVAKHGNFVVSAAIYNSFSNNIGRISNCAMKLAAVEYDETLPKVEGLPEAAFCTILTGTEIDACKKGLRPDISKVLGYKGNEDKSHRAVVRAIETFIEAKKFLEKRKSSKKPEFYYDTNKNLKLKNEKLGVKIESNFEHNPVTQLLYRWADSFMNFTPTKAVNFPDELPKLTEIFPEHNPKAAETKAILLAFNEVAAKYSKWIDARDIRLKNRKTDDSKIFTRLIGQYDDIHEFGDNSLEKQMKRLMEEIYIVTEKYPKTEIQALKTTLYGNDKKIDANTFWPYGKEALENPLYREINQRTNFESFLKNFYFEGYRLLYLVLDNAPSVEDTGENLGKINTDCPYMERYYDSAVHCYKIRNLIKTKFEAELVEMALNDLKKVLSCSEKNELISKIYPPKGGEKARRAFWKIFTVGEVLSALGGDSDAK